MKVKLKKLKDQVIVITGATSGIGLAAARKAAHAGARVVLCGRSEDSLRTIEGQLRSSGCQVVTQVADVCQEGDLERVAQAAIDRFGGFDTWVNNAGVGLYGRALDVPLEDQRKLFETNFWGVVMGTRIAARHLSLYGGALINIGSVVSDRTIPLIGIYSASKAAVKAYTDAVRMELEEEGKPVSVTLIQPTSMDTPFPQHARNYLNAEPRLADPVYNPELAAEAIVRAAEKPTRNVIVGGAGRAIATMGAVAPRLTDRYMEKALIADQHREVSTGKRRDIFDQPSEDPRERGYHDGQVLDRSAYNWTITHPQTTTAIAVGAGLAVAALLSRRSRGFSRSASSS